MQLARVRLRWPCLSVHGEGGEEETHRRWDKLQINSPCHPGGYSPRIHSISAIARLVSVRAMLSFWLHEHNSEETASWGSGTDACLGTSPTCHALGEETGWIGLTMKVSCASGLIRNRAMCMIEMVMLRCTIAKNYWICLGIMRQATSSRSESHVDDSDRQKGQEHLLKDPWQIEYNRMTYTIIAKYSSVLNSSLS